LHEIVAAAWESALCDALEDNVLTPEEEHALIEFRDRFNLSSEELDRKGSYSKLVKAAVLRELFEGKIPERVHVRGSIPFNLKRGETIVWVFNNVQYYECRARRTYVGGYGGLSVRVAKGVYLKGGAFRGNPVVTTQTMLVDQGTLAATKNHLYFQGPRKSFRVPYDKITSFTPYADGIGIQRDAPSARPQSFLTGDGWFAYNLIANLARLAAG
jgi:hypothetical protein